MIRKFTLIMLFLFMLGIGSFSQTAVLENIYASPGENKPVALTVSGFNGIGSLTFNIQFDATVMTFTGITSVASPGLSAYITGNTINIAGYWQPSATFSGKLLDLNFTYNGMTTSPLNFLGSCVVTQGVTVINPAYTNGSVSMAVVPQTAKLISATASTGGNVTVPIEYSGMPVDNISAITQIIHYDPTKLSFVNVIGIGNLASGLNQSVNSSAGVITLTWTNVIGKTINSPSNKFLLNFVYIGNTITNIDFMAGCIITTSNYENVPVTYSSATVNIDSPDAFASLGSITDASQGQDYEIPVTFTNFPSGTSGGTQAFTLTIPFDASKLSFIGIKNPVSGLVVGNSAGVLTLVWSDPNGTPINGPSPFLTLKFKYNGIGTANVSFGNGCVFNTYNSSTGIVTAVQVAYTNATLVPAVVDENATIGFVQSAVGANVLVPVTFTNLPATMGAVTLKISYDYNKLTFVDLQNNTFGATVNVDPLTHIVNVAWNASSATNINAKFLDLRFIYNGGGGVQSAAVNFADGCELANFSGVIVPASWVNGGVNFLFKVSGILRYNNDAGTPLKDFTVKLKTSPGGLDVGSATTNASGYYEIMVTNGFYTLTAEPSATAGYFSDENDAQQIRFYAGGFGWPEINALREYAGDVNQDLITDENDAQLIDFRAGSWPYTAWTLSDWVFGGLIAVPVTVTVSNSNSANIDFYGLCSGNVTGSYIP